MVYVVKYIKLIDTIEFAYTTSACTFYFECAQKLLVFAERKDDTKFPFAHANLRRKPDWQGLPNV